jgi:hypothetical protein
MEFHQRNHEIPLMSRPAPGGGQGTGRARAEGLRMAEHGLDAIEHALTMDPMTFLRTTAQDSAQ